MRITSVEPVVLSIPFEAGGRGEGIMPSAWTALDVVLVKIGTDAGLTGWGEGFGYFCAQATAALVRRAIAPVLKGREFAGAPALNEELQRKMVLQGRYGISTFALSGADIALWDLDAKAAGVSLARRLGERRRESVPAYASLVRYGDADLVARYAGAAAAEGYPEIKLHEITMPEIRRCRQVLGGAVPFSVDVNCNWTMEYARGVIPELLEMEVSWLEEPVFPPEDFRALGALRRTGISIATGENACTAFQFNEIIRAEGADLIQPSVTKAGGVTEFLKVTELCGKHGLRLMPHSPYFGPGYLAALQMAAVEPRFELFEYLYVKPEAFLFPGMPLPEKGAVAVPDGPGLGIDPDPAVIERYRV